MDLELENRVKGYLADPDTVKSLQAAHIATMIITGQTTLEEVFPEGSEEEKGA